MAHYAYLDESNVVTQVIVGRDENEDGVDWEEYYGAIRTSYNTHANQHAAGGNPFRFNYAGIGYTFDPTLGPDGGFIPPQPFASWTLNRGTGTWQPPTPMPPQGDWAWDEKALTWVEVTPRP